MANRFSTSSHLATPELSGMSPQALDLATLQSLLAAGESQTVEFKQQLPHPDQVAKSLGAIANTAGGWLLVGVRDDGQVMGVPEPEACQDQLGAIATQALEPPLAIAVGSLCQWGQTIVWAAIPDSPDKPHRLFSTGQVYLRHQASNLPAPPAMVKHLQPRPLTPPTDKYELAILALLQQSPSLSQAQICHRLNLSDRRAQRFLTALLRTGHLQELHHKAVPHYALTHPDFLTDA